jgi:hypothetical protein
MTPKHHAPAAFRELSVVLLPNLPHQPVGPILKHIAEEHQQFAEEEESDEGESGNHPKRHIVLSSVSAARSHQATPSRLTCVWGVPLHEIRDLHGKEGGHEADRQEEDAQFGEERGTSRQAGRCLRIFLGRDLEELPGTMSVMHTVNGMGCRGCTHSVRQGILLLQAFLDSVQHQHLEAVFKAIEAAAGGLGDLDIPGQADRTRRNLAVGRGVPGVRDSADHVLVALEQILELAQLLPQCMQMWDDVSCFELGSAAL